MDTFNLAAKSGAWTATLEIIKIKKAASSRMKIYVVKVVIKTAKGTISTLKVEEDVYNSFDPESWRTLCALRAGNMDDVSISEIVNKMQ